jgi:hypothetical protein
LHCLEISPAISWIFVAGSRVRRLAEGNPDGAPPERLEQVRNRVTCSSWSCEAAAGSAAGPRREMFPERITERRDDEPSAWRPA